MNANNKLYFLLIILGLYCCQARAQTVTDIDGNLYNTVIIGAQVWMKENLRVTHYNNGDSIPNITNNTSWAALSTPAYCWYNNDYDTYGTVYGALYNWFTVDTASNSNKNLCPTGWHIPADAEWVTLTTYLGGENAAGGKMKEAGTVHWSAPNTGATNESGFTALPGGYRGYVSGSFNYTGIFGHWWSSTPDDASLAWGIGMFYLDSSINNSTSVKKNGFCLRCIKDPVNHINDEQDIESSYSLYQNYPNPFNPNTKIILSLHSTGPSNLEIFDIAGRLVRSYSLSGFLPGKHSIEWDGTDNQKNSVPSGTYFYRLSTENQASAMKMILLR